MTSRKNKNNIMIIQSHYNISCNECKSTPLIFDVIHQDLYCPFCGLIHENNIIPKPYTLRFERIPINENTLYFY